MGSISSRRVQVHAFWNDLWLRSRFERHSEQLFLGLIEGSHNVYDPEYTTTVPRRE